ncbi:MAG TPA: type I methionyl aminopeptidase [Actinomycetota bacterium]|nr:type I methionyl aminopeptidase [Actinomycetota bacterium]HVL90823.1 type I methionyl aminopeptidase [Actinomycetota bacterium]
MIFRKTPDEIQKMRRAGAVVAETLAVLREAVRPGVSTRELDEIAEREITGRGAIPSFKGYRGFPATICTSVNYEIVHGIPGDVVLRDGDLIKLDCGAIVEGYHGDSAITLPVGEVEESARKLIEATERALWAGIQEARPGNRIGDIGAAVQTVAEGAGFSVVREYVGHGIGRALHEDPPVPNYGTARKGLPLEEGLVIAIEPMVNVGSFETRLLPDGWTVVTADGNLSAHFEHTICITAEGPEVLTALREVAA